MIYEDLYRRYGAHVSERIWRELAESEIAALDVSTLPSWLESRAESAHENNVHLLTNPQNGSINGTERTKEACRYWREAEDLAYLVAIAEDVSMNARAVGF